MTIPKIIHYCWFGKNPMPQQFEKNIATWKTYCPDYEFKLWTEENYDVYKNQYVAQAYDCQKWAFVSDYVRLDVVATYGGIYLDTDVELIKSLDSLLSNDCFLALEYANAVNTGIGFGAIPHHPFIIENRDVYDQSSFLDEKGKPKLQTCVEITTQLLKKRGLQPVDKNQQLGDITIYASDYFAPFQMATQKLKLTPRTIGIHQYSASWKHQNKMVHWLWQKTLPLKFKLRSWIGDERYEAIKKKLK